MTSSRLLGSSTPRSERLYLSDIVTAAEAIGDYVEGSSLEEFVGLDLVRRAVLQRLTEIGEAASRLSPEFRAHHADIPWSDIVGFRNIAVHAYFAVDWRIVWFAATRNAPDVAELRLTVPALHWHRVAPPWTGRSTAEERTDLGPWTFLVPLGRSAGGDGIDPS